MQNPDDLETLVEAVLCVVPDFGCAFVSDTLNQWNVMQEDSVKRRENWRIKDRCEWSILTSMSMVRFQHIRFAHKRTNETAYLMDLIMGLTSYTRLSRDAKALVLEEDVQSSCEKAGQCLPEEVSKETVIRIVRSLDLSHLLEDKPEKKHQTKALYVEADEDHIALQFHEKKGELLEKKERGKAWDYLKGNWKGAKVRVRRRKRISGAVRRGM